MTERAGKKGQRGYAAAIAVVVLFLIVAFGLTVLLQYAIEADQKIIGSEQIAQDVYRGIVGNPELGTFGYVGDVGNYPASLTDLLALPAGSPAGWNGPYVRDVPFDSSGVMLDAYGSMLEYFLSIGTIAAPSTHAVAVIGRGPNKGSTDTPGGSGNANIAANFSGLAPTAAAYRLTSPNTDNLVVPDVIASSSALNFGYTGNLTVTVNNRNIASSTNLAGCPLVYDLKITSKTRGTNDEILVPFGSTMSAELVQGVYNLRLVANSNIADSYYGDAITILPGARTTRTFYVSSVNTTTAPVYNLTIRNSFGANLFLRNELTLGAVGGGTGQVNSGATTTLGTVAACATIAAHTVSLSGATVDTFQMPNAAYTRVIANTTQVLTVKNTTGTYRQVIVQVGNPGIGVGTVYSKRIGTFVLPTNSRVTLTDPSGNAISGTPITLAGATTLSP